MIHLMLFPNSESFIQEKVFPIKFIIVRGTTVIVSQPPPSLLSTLITQAMTSVNLGPTTMTREWGYRITTFDILATIVKLALFWKFSVIKFTIVTFEKMSSILESPWGFQPRWRFFYKRSKYGAKWLNLGDFIG